MVIIYNANIRYAIFIGVTEFNKSVMKFYSRQAFIVASNWLLFGYKLIVKFNLIDLNVYSAKLVPRRCQVGAKLVEDKVMKINCMC